MADAFDDYDLVPRQGTGILASAKWWRIFIVAAMCSGLLALLLSAAGLFSSNDTATTSAQSPLVNTGMATVAAKEWLAGQRLSIPSSTDCGAGEPPLGDIEGFAWQRGVAAPGEAEIHIYIVRAGDVFYRMSVKIVMVRPEGELAYAAIDGCPSLSAIADHTNSGGAEVTGWVGWPKIETSAPVGLQRQAEAWADAYFGNNPEALYRVTGDTEVRSYLPLGGALAVEDVVVDYYAAKPDQVLVHVLVATSRGSVLGYDLLMLNPSSTLPPVVSWGPTGSGASLAPYSQAVPTGSSGGVVATTTTSTVAPTTTAAATTTVAPTTTQPATTVAPAAPADVCPEGDTSGNPADGLCVPAL